ncbi:AcrR family transcriptional regulator [Streptomyces sp. SAI-135]|uniref:TetR/AcrR family transcriptional regulator n=1 Tax=unclassified Streptomyces TaxID=2593676 RepID=UPI0024770625|nr:MULTISPECIES: TetR/AcrR family transcriptional regulator [unclassified Streptomyces]MDH6523066.1 AcrR family transcriptional regulator [Streptomyces sp. SAI-090]MDH6573949.1 AcrR family transcriptional regulator [Streptomyces sp. SAI-117]MDH6581314.1 AcrR family transcriptional regulator [Streptomyces sp. SAI-133]MDH6613321.1 AcrR family transcriptional regulator [Streptomyces sp. SAI-135]
MPARRSRNGAGPSPESYPGTTDDAPADLRADARHNRERILKAARGVFAAQGVDTPMSAIARRAGVAVATLYRHFPTRSTLVAAAYDDQLAVCTATLEKALADPNPAHGLFRLLDTACTTLVTDRGFDTVFMTRVPEALDYNRERTRAKEGLSRLIQRARAAGQLRDDFEPADIQILLLAVSGLAQQPPETAVPAARRLLTYLFQSFQAHPPAQPGPLPPAPPMNLRRDCPAT